MGGEKVGGEKGSGVQLSTSRLRFLSRKGLSKFEDLIMVPGFVQLP